MMKPMQHRDAWLFGALLLLVSGLCVGAPVQGCKKSVDSLSQEARLEAQALTDPDEDKIYHANKINDVTFMNKKSMITRNKQNNVDCEDTEDSEKKANIVVLDGKAAPKSQIIKLDTKQKPAVEKKSSTIEALTNQKIKIQSLQDSIHTNLIKLFHHLKHKHGSNAEEDQKEVNEAKEALIADAKEMTAMDHDPSPAENFLKGLDNNTLLKSMLHNKAKEAIESITNDAKSDDETTTSKKQSKAEPLISDVQSSKASSSNDSSIESDSKSNDHTTKDETDTKENNENKFNSEHTKLGKFTVNDKEDTTVTKIKVKEVKEYSKPSTDSKHDPYAEIAATPDNVKMPPDTKLPKEDPSVVPVGMSKQEENDDIKDDYRERRPGIGRAGGGFMPDLPVPGDFGGPSEAPGQGGQGDMTNSGTTNPDLSNQNILKSMRADALQAQLQDQIKEQAYEGQLMGLVNRASRMKGAFGKDGDMIGMNNIPNGAMGMNGMGGGMGGGTAGMGGGMFGGMGGMGGGMGGMGGGMAGMGGGMAGMAGMGGGMGGMGGGMGGMGGGMGGMGGGMGGMGGGMGSMGGGMGGMGGGMGGMAAMTGMGGMGGGQGGIGGAIGGLDGLGDGTDGVSPAIMGGMRGMNGMGGMEGMNGMQGMNGMGGIGGMGGMRGMNGMGAVAYARSPGYGMYGSDSMGYDRDRFDEGDSYRREPSDNGEEPYGYDEDQPMADEQATGRNHVPEYPGPKSLGIIRGYRRSLYNSRYFDDDSQLDEDEEDEEDEGRGIPRSRAPNPSRYEDLDDDSDDGVHYYDRKAVIAKAQKTTKTKLNH